MFFNLIRSIICYIIILILIYSCSPRISRHGNFFTKEELNILRSAKLNKSEILEILGQPSTKSTFSDNVWYYIYFVQKERAVFEVRNTDNTVLKIKFDSKQNVEKYDITRNEVSINININNDSSESSPFKRGLALELLNSFIRRIEEPN